MLNIGPNISDTKYIVTDSLVNKARRIISNETIRFMTRVLHGDIDFLFRLDDKQMKEAENLKRWFDGYKKTKNYEGKNFKIDSKYETLIKSFDTADAKFDEVVEMIVGDLLRDYFKSMYGYENLKIYNTSKYDDIKSGVDYIVCLDEKKQYKEYIGIDLTLSNRPDILQNKGLRYKTHCEEFQSYLGKGRIEMPRQVLDMKSDQIFLLVNKYIKEVLKNGKVNDGATLDMFLKICPESQTGLENNDVGIQAREVVRNTKAKFENLLKH